MPAEHDRADKALDNHYGDVRRIARWLDDAFVVPGTRFRIGWDGIVGLIPGVGDLLTTLPAVYIVLRALNMGVPNVVAGRMLLNILIDDIVGAIPILGDLFDVTWKANRRNVALLERYHRDAAGTRRRSAGSLAVAAVGLLLLAAGLIALPILILIWLTMAIGGGSS